MVFSVFLNPELMKKDSPEWLCSCDENKATKRYTPAKNTEMKFLKILLFPINIAAKVKILYDCR